MTTIPNNEPSQLRIGSTWKWTRTFTDYPAGTWTLKYSFKSAAGGFEIDAAASGADFSIVVAAATTVAYTAGDYTWMAWVEGGSNEKYDVDSGSVTLLPDYRAGTSTDAFDGRSHAKKMLDAIKAWLESRDPAVAQYEIAGRRMQYIPITDLLKLQNRYQLEVQNEENAAKLARGEGIGRKIQFRV